MHKKSTYLDLCPSFYLFASSSFLRARVSAVAILNSNSAPDQNTAEIIMQKIFTKILRQKNIEAKKLKMLIFSSFFICLFSL